jgi:hypothetical protein
MMSDEAQRTLSGYKSNVHEQGEYENPNEGKPALSDTEEYVLRLNKPPKVIQQTKTKEKDGIKKNIKVDTAVCEFIEKDTKNIVVAFFRVDSLNFSTEDAYESGVIRFFKKIKNPLVEGVAPDWDNYFIPGIRFRSRVVVKLGPDKLPTGVYYLDVPTCRPLLPSDKAGEDFEKPPQTTMPPKPSPEASELANAKLIAHGCANRTDALQRLADAKIDGSIIAAFVRASNAGEITYPI